MNNNGKPISRRQAVQLMVLLTLLAWATQTLFHQWGFGAEIAPATEPSPAVAIVAAEKFVPTELGIRSIARGTLVLRADATVSETQVKIRNICRWSDGDAGLFEPMADLTITKVPAASGYTSITVDQVRATLRDAGMNLALVSVSGATACAVNRSDTEVDERAALQSWINAHDGSEKQIATTPVEQAAMDVTPERQAVPTSAPAMAVNTTDVKPLHSLRDILCEDLCTRLHLSPDALQMTFNSGDEKILNLVEPYFHFDVTPRRVRDLGQVSWDVAIVSEGVSQKTQIVATARAWQTQVIVNEPLSYRQVIRDKDLVDKRTLIERLPDEPFVTREQAVGQQASRDLKPGQILTSHLVDPVLLARPGQLITVNVTRGTVKITTVAKALDGGSYGQSIRVRNDAEPPQMFDITLTGPQEGVVSDAPGATPLAARN